MLDQVRGAYTVYRDTTRGKLDSKMSRLATDVQESAEECTPSPPLPADHVFNSGAVLFPGAFDQHGCPLIMFPLDAQDKLSSDLSKAEVVDFINYFLCLHNKKQVKESLVSVVADLRQASLQTTRFIAETLLLLELHKRTVHSVYIIQPKKKDVLKLLLKLLSPSKSYTTSFKKVLLKEIPELSNYIDRSQLTAPLGGYLVYCHHSWVAFIKEIHGFVQEFLSVVQRLPACISTLQALSRLQLPSTFSELQQFCSTNEAKFQQLRRELGLDKLLTRCENILEKLRYPESEASYQAMAGTPLFTHTAFDMLQNHSRITAAVEKVELLWQQAFSKARQQLQVCQLREDSLQVTEQIKTLFEEKLQSYKIEIAQDGARAAMLVSDFEMSVHTPAVALVRWAEDVIHTLSEVVLCDGLPAERWALDLERLKEKLHSAVLFILQTLRAVSSYHHYYNKACCWYRLVLCENFLQELLSGINGGGDPAQRQRRSRGSSPAWRHKMSSFLRRNPPPDLEELVHLAHLSSVIPDEEVQQEGKQISQRCLTLRKLLLSSDPVSVAHLQLALQWQYELLRSNHVDPSSADGATNGSAQDVPDLRRCESVKGAAVLLTASPPAAVPGSVSAEGKPASLSSFDSGFDGAGSSQLEIRDSVRPALIQPQTKPQTHRENLCSVSDCDDLREEFDFGSVGNSSRASIQIIPKVSVESLNFEIKVKRSAALPSNPWLSLPVDDLENSYTVTITQNPTLQKRDLQSSRCRDQPTQTDVLSSTQPCRTQTSDWILHSQSSLEDPELSPIRNVLSSTITDQRDKSTCTTEGIPTLLWDSYDLHDQEQDSVDRLIDMKDWDVSEQEGLMEVERILDRADEILEKEENVLAQEAVLDALLRSEVRHDQWPQWDREITPGVMSSSELAEAGVLGLDDDLEPAESDNLSGPRSAGPADETEAFEYGTASAAATEAETYRDLLSELRQVQVLDKLIMEENLKILELRRREESPAEELIKSKPLDANGPFSVSKERETFRLQVEKEKLEVEKLEKSLNKERKMKKHKHRATKVIKCSILEKARSESMEDQTLCDEMLSGKRSQRTHSTVQVHSDSQDEHETETGPEVSKDASQESDLLPDSQNQDCSSEAEPKELNRTTFICTSESEGPPEEPEIKPQGSVTKGEPERPEEDAAKPESSLANETRPDDGAFDPGGNSHLPPVPKLRKTLLPVNDNLTELDTTHSPELQSPAPVSVPQDPGPLKFDFQDEEFDAVPENLTSGVDHSSVFNPNVKEHSNNNNNNHANSEVSSQDLPDLTSEDEEDTLVGPAFELQTDLPPAQEIQAQLHPDSPLYEFDLRGRDKDEEDDEDWLDGVQRSEIMRISGPRSPGIQAQLDISIREMSDFKTPVVLDTGSGLMKAGFADQDLPNVIFPTIIGQPKYEEIMNGNLDRETYIGHEAQHMRGVLALKHPIKNGMIQNWDDMEKIWHYTFQLLCVDPVDHPVLLTEAAMNPLQNRQRMVEIMFEYFSVPFTYVAMQAVLALYAAGKSSGVVFDSGDGVSHSVPVFEGYCLPHAVQRFPLAGVDVTMHLKKLLQEQGVCMRTTAEMEIVREMKEKCCCVALNYESELSQGRSCCREMHYTMPDGQVVSVGTERFRAPEILFKPELIGRDHYGMHESIFKSILSSDIDLRRCFLGNIVLSGGNTLLTGLPERLQAEIKGLVPSDMGKSVHVTSPKDRDFSVWSGGAVLANLPCFSSTWISQDEYEEHGPQIVFRKCF
ncbi:uncharacterized protein LOC117823778 [Notolabrus celidotus]|uniref:uncharacterized protein LOC117823778 n=1 Tax=Notolabrus celidotus TaxID=1203425 RepID=UPI00148FAA59|nr:uncharacterized protein LOC117823778 [Notolabrus celidotus]